MKINLTVRGVTPLIINRFTDEDAQGATNGSRSSSAARDRGQPQDDARNRLYVGLDGETPIVPVVNMFQCVISGGQFFKIGKKQITTQRSSLVPACVTVLGKDEGVELPIMHEQDWKVDTRPVRIPATGGRILRHRPMFDDWKLELVIDLDEEWNENLMRDIVDAAGKKIGLCDYRPQCRGPYGKFVVDAWECSNGK